MKIAITLSYDGTNYCGWQVQPNGVTIQQLIEDAVFSVTGERVRVTGSGRTDAGVHARGQVAHFSLEKTTIPPEKFAKALNAHLPNDVRVFESREVDQDFNACTSAKRKTYRYSLYLSEVEQPLKQRYATCVHGKVDVELMKKGSQLFVGEHDFACFNASGSGAKTTVRTIYSIDIIESGQDLFIEVTGNGFLYNMVRTLSGTLLALGQGEKTLQDLQNMLKTGDRTLCGRTLSAKGLCLEKVEYQ